MLGNHLTAQLTIGKLVVTDNIDLLNLRLWPFSNFKHDINAVLVKLNQLWFNDGSKAPLALIQFDNACNVSPHLRPRINLARRQLYLGFNLVILDAFITFKNDAVHDWVFSHFDDNRAGIVAHGDIGEQFGRVKVLKRLVGRHLSPWLAGA